MKKRQPPQRKPSRSKTPGKLVMPPNPTALFDNDDVVMACKIFYGHGADEDIAYSPEVLTGMRQSMMFALRAAAVNLGVH